MKIGISRSRKISLVLAVVCTAALVLAACNMPTPGEGGDPVEQAIQTLQAQATQDYYSTVVAQLTPTTPSFPVSPTNTITAPTNTQPQPGTPLPTATQQVIIVTPTPIPATATPIPPTATPVPCNQASFVGDVTIPDGTKLVAGTTFTKTWKIKNSGSCTWTDQYDVTFVKGDQLGTTTIVDLPKAVKPGETIEISVPMVVPSTPGTYKSHWQLVNTNGVRFGTGPDSKGTFWVEIVATEGKGNIYSFAAHACDAKWSSSSKNPLPCPGKETSIDEGYVLTKDQPIREDGGKENEIGLITRPDDADAGYIQGIYPSFPIKNGDRFRAAIQCEGNSPKCKLKFELYYRLADGNPKELGEWHEISDNLWNRIDVDLSALAGQNVQFYLVVWNDGTSVDNRGLWLNPVIYRP